MCREEQGILHSYSVNGFPWWLSSKASSSQNRRCRFSPWVGKIPWRRKWQPTPVFLPGESHGRRSLWTTVHGVAKLSHLSKFSQLMAVKVKVAQSCPTLCDPMDSTVHGILQARILEWVPFPFSRGSSQPRD